MAGSCPPRAPTGPPQGAPQSPMRPAQRMRRRPPGSTAPPAAGGAKAGPPQATQAQDDTLGVLPEPARPSARRPGLPPSSPAADERPHFPSGINTDDISAVPAPSTIP